MKFCQAHWDKLHDAIKDRGLWHLVAKSGEAAQEAAKRQLEGTDTAADFDPLMSAHWAIYARAIDCGGLYLMGTDESGANDGDFCPLCELNKHADRTGMPEGQGEPSDHWINGCCDAQLEYARELGLVSGVQ